MLKAAVRQQSVTSLTQNTVRANVGYGRRVRENPLIAYTESTHSAEVAG